MGLRSSCLPVPIATLCLQVLILISSVGLDATECQIGSAHPGLSWLDDGVHFLASSL